MFACIKVLQKYIDTMLKLFLSRLSCLCFHILLFSISKFTNTLIHVSVSIGLMLSWYWAVFTYIHVCMSRVGAGMDSIPLKMPQVVPQTTNDCVDVAVPDYVTILQETEVSLQFLLSS